MVLFESKAQDTTLILFEGGFNDDTVSFYINDIQIFEDSLLKSDFVHGITGCVVELVSIRDSMISINYYNSRNELVQFIFKYSKIINVRLLVNEIEYSKNIELDKFIGLAMSYTDLEYRRSKYAPEYE